MLSLVAFWRPVLALALVPFVEQCLWVVALELLDASLPLCLRSDLMAMSLEMAAVLPSPFRQPILAVAAVKQGLAVSVLDLAHVSVPSRGWLASSLLRPGAVSAWFAVPSSSFLPGSSFCDTCPRLGTIGRTF